MIIVSTGVPGVGATTVTRKAINKVEGWQQENYGDVMVEVAKDQGIIKHRDQMRKVNPEKQREIQKKAAKELLRRGKGENKNIVIDTHCTIKTPKGFLCGLPEWVLSELEMDNLVLIEANPEEIVERRQEDESRERDKENTEEIEEHQEINRIAAISYSTFTGATVKFIKNHDNSLQKAVDEMVELMR